VIPSDFGSKNLTKFGKFWSPYVQLLIQKLDCDNGSTEKFIVSVVQIPTVALDACRRFATDYSNNHSKIMH